jgi:hypothetical protein
VLPSDSGQIDLVVPGPGTDLDGIDTLCRTLGRIAQWGACLPHTWGSMPGWLWSCCPPSPPQLLCRCYPLAWRRWGWGLPCPILNYLVAVFPVQVPCFSVGEGFMYVRPCNWWSPWGLALSLPILSPCRLVLWCCHHNRLSSLLWWLQGGAPYRHTMLAAACIMASRMGLVRPWMAFTTHIVVNA